VLPLVVKEYTSSESSLTTLKAHGLEARRVPRSGGFKSYPGDVRIVVAGREFILECKERKFARASTFYGD
jgi:Holliday junction resolvase